VSQNDLEIIALNDELRRPQLFEWHKAHGDVVPFAGWEMPVRYTDIRKEHLAVRNAVGIFDTRMREKTQYYALRIHAFLLQTLEWMP